MPLVFRTRIVPDPRRGQEAAPIPPRKAMADATQPIGQPLRRYETPALLADIELLDLLELSGSTVETAHLLNLSQPTVSRRRRQLGAELALELAGATRQEGGM